MAARLEHETFETVEAMQFHRGCGRTEMIEKLLNYAIRAKQVTCTCDQLSDWDDWPVVNNRCGDCGRVINEKEEA